MRGASSSPKRKRRRSFMGCLAPLCAQGSLRRCCRCRRLRIFSLLCDVARAVGPQEMTTEKSEELYPILVADVADQESCDLLRAYAQQHETVAVPLLAPPVDRRVHMLEVYAPNATAPVRFKAEPVGGPTGRGFPLRLEPWPDSDGGFDDPDDDTPTLIKLGAV